MDQDPATKKKGEKNDGLSNAANDKVEGFSNNNNQQTASVVNVKELGRKARARLEQERTKRAEIVCLDLKEVQLPELTRNRKTTTSQKQPPTSTLATAGFKQKSIATTRSALAKKRRVAKTTTAAPEHADMWVPNLSHILVSSYHFGNKNERSSLVRLHGLPVDITPAQIRNFFEGLEPQLIRVLLSCPTHIEEWDDKGDRNDNFRKPSHALVRRHPSNFRVVVKFDSAPTAELAAERSGETLELLAETHQVNKNNFDKWKRCAIGVTPCSKQHAAVILQRLSIDIMDQKRVPILQTLGRVEQELLPAVSQVLWMEARRQLNLSFSARIPPNSRWNEDVAVATSYMDILKCASALENESEYSKMARCRNRLLDLLQDWKQAPPFPTVDLLDPALAVADPVVRLTHEASQVLRTFINHLDQRLLMARRRTKLGAVSPPLKSIE